MILGPKILLSLVKEKKLVENLSKRELENPEGAGFDLRVGEVYKIKGRGFLGIDERKTPDAVLYKKYDPKKNQVLKIKPGDYFLFKTLEKVNLPENLSGILFTRGTLFRCGLLHGLSQIAPGYCGELITSVYNAGGQVVKIELGARFIHVIFQEVKGGGNLYRGQWKGGRVSAKKKEKQV